MQNLRIVNDVTNRVSYLTELYLVLKNIETCVDYLTKISKHVEW